MKFKKKDGSIWTAKEDSDFAKTLLKYGASIHMEEEETIVTEVTTDPKDYTVKDLKDMCKEKGLKGYSKLSEEELINLLEL